MEERPFKDKTIKPEEPALKIAMDNRFVTNQKLVGLVDSIHVNGYFQKAAIGWSKFLIARRL